MVGASCVADHIAAEQQSRDLFITAMPHRKDSPAQDGSAHGTSASVGRAERTGRSDGRRWSGWMWPSLRAAEECPIHAQERIFRVNADQP